LLERCSSEKLGQDNQILYLRKFYELGYVQWIKKTFPQDAKNPPNTVICKKIADFE
jgi:hypothetical protein